MVIRHTPRAPPTPRNHNDPEQARRTLFPGEGATVGSPIMGSQRRQHISNGGTDNKIRSPKYSTIVLTVSTVLLATSLLLTFLTWNNSTITSNILHPGVQSDSTTSLRLTPAKNSKLIQAIQKAPIGSLGPSGTNRAHLRYYDTLFYTTLQYGANAKSIIEVGCASDPFIQYLDWIDQRTCVAPYFVEYGKFSKTKEDLGTKIATVTADFMEYQLPNGKKFDLLLCNQVLEHVVDPASFMKKLIESASTSIISVPYNWEGCGEVCNHKTDFITMSTLTEWSAPYLPIYRGVVTEDFDGKFNKRVIFVFETS